jgi:16S rRNA (guanine966-N2)-methyltransferase
MPPAPANRIRIIGGRYRGRIIRFPPAEGLRPTPDRVRETLFNWLGQDLTGLRTLDLYAGSGALTLEALSRGAALAVAVERNTALVRSLREAAVVLDAPRLEAHVADALVHLGREARRFDVIFLDPPFASNDWARLLPPCRERLAAGGFIYAEAGCAIAPPAELTLWRHAKAGAVHYHLFVRAEEAQAQT